MEKGHRKSRRREGKDNHGENKYRNHEHLGSSNSKIRRMDQWGCRMDDKDYERRRDPNMGHYDAKGCERKEEEYYRNDQDQEREKVKVKGRGAETERERERDGENKERFRDSESKNDVKSNKRNHYELNYNRKDEENINKKNNSSSGLSLSAISRLEESLAAVIESPKFEKTSVKRERTLCIAEVFEEMKDIVLEESGDVEPDKHSTKGLAIAKALHGHEELGVLKNVKSGQKQPLGVACNAAKIRADFYEDSFNGETSTKKNICLHYDDAVENEGIIVNETGCLMQEEMPQFKKPKKKIALRKKDKLELDDLEAEGVSTELGNANRKSQSSRGEEHVPDVQVSCDAYQLVYAKAKDNVRQELPSKNEVEGEEIDVFGNEDGVAYKSLEGAKRFSLKKHHGEAASGPQAVAFLAQNINNQSAETQTKETEENKVVFTELEEFVSGLQFKVNVHKPKGEDINMNELQVLQSPDQETKDESLRSVHAGPEKEINPDESMHEVSVEKGLSGALKLLKERGTLQETIELAGRKMDMQKSKLVGFHKNEGPKEIHIERLDEFGKEMTAKEAFRKISHKFHGKEPGKKKQEKRMKQNELSRKLKQMKNSDTPSFSVERMREVQARIKTPVIVLTRNLEARGDKKVENLFGKKRKCENSSMQPPKKEKANY